MRLIAGLNGSYSPFLAVLRTMEARGYVLVSVIRRSACRVRETMPAQFGTLHTSRATRNCWSVARSHVTLRRRAFVVLSGSSMAAKFLDCLIKFLQRENGPLHALHTMVPKLLKNDPLSNRDEVRYLLPTLGRPDPRGAARNVGVMQQTASTQWTTGLENETLTSYQI